MASFVLNPALLILFLLIFYSSICCNCVLLVYAMTSESSSRIWGKTQMVVHFIMSNVRGACQLFPNHMGTPNEETQHCKYTCTVWLSGLYVVHITIVSSAYTRCAFTYKAVSGQKNTITTSSRNIFQLIGHV